MPERISGTLSAGVVEDIVLQVPADVVSSYTDNLGRLVTRRIANRAAGVIVMNVGGQGAIYFTINGSDPEVAADDSYGVPAGVGLHRSAAAHIEDEVVVKLISDEDVDFYVAFDNATQSSYNDIQDRVLTLETSSVSSEELDEAISHTAPDVGSVDVDTTEGWVNLMTGFGVFDLGTDSTSTLKWIRQGRLVFCQFEIRATADHEDGVLILSGAFLPFAPSSEFIAYPSGFTYVQCVESSPGASDGGLMPLGPTISPPLNGLVFTQMSMQPGDGGLDNVWWTSGNGMTLDLTGRAFDVFGAFVYEAATARP